MTTIGQETRWAYTTKLQCLALCSVLRPLQHNIGVSGLLQRAGHSSATLLVRPTTTKFCDYQLTTVKVLRGVKFWVFLLTFAVIFTTASTTVIKRTHQLHCYTAHIYQS